MKYIPYSLSYTATFKDHGEFLRDFHEELGIPKSVTKVNVKHNGFTYEGVRISTASGRIHFRKRRLEFIANNPTLQPGDNMDIEVGWDEPSGEMAERKIHYWAGGFGSVDNPGRLKDFIDNEYWQAIDYDKADQSSVAKQARFLFSKIAVGDKFLIKGFGGRSDLKVHFVGTVIDKDEVTERLELERQEVTLYNAKAPSGPGAGVWFNTLLEVTRPQDIALLFGAPPEIIPGITNNVKNQLSNISINTIFYGPPGTGKTHKMQELIATNNLLVPAKVGDKDYDGFVKDYHWWQIVAMVFLDLSEHKAKVPELVKHPLIQAKYAQSSIENLRARLWSTLQHHTVESCPNVKLKKRHGEPIFYKEADSVWRLDDITGFKADFDLLAEELSDFKKSGTQKEVKNYIFTTCHQSLSYEDFIEGIKPKLDKNEAESEDEEGEVKYEIRKGYFYQACNRAAQLAGFTNLKICIDATKEDRRQKFDQAIKDGKVFYLFLDEINRCNVAAVFGELITLIEDNKRLGGKNEIADTLLPYSQKPFGVPANLFVVGTMNTADRSVEALDTALRRRFSFEQMKSQPELLGDKKIGDIVLKDLLTTINERITYLLDEDHQIGHSYFYDIAENDADGLVNAFRNKIVPLLKEYFYNDYEKIMLVLGDGFVTEKSKPPKFAHNGTTDLDKTVYTINDISDIATLTAALKITLNGA